MRVLSAVALAAIALPAFAAPVRIERVDVGRGPSPVVRLHLSGPLEPLARTLQADGNAPDRIYIDFYGAALGPRVRAPIDGSGPLVRVRTGQFDASTARVVLDLAGNVPYEVQVKGRVVSIVVAPPPPPTTTAKPSASPPTAPPPEPKTAAVPAPKPPSEPASPAREPQSPVALGPVSPIPGVVTPMVVIDPGHGGRDPGASGVNGVLEKDIVLALATKLAERLPQRLRVDTMLTRHDDSYIALDQRLPPPDSNAALFLSLHANAASDPTAHGPEIFYGGGRVRTASLGLESPQAILLGQTVEQSLRTHLGFVRAGARPAGFAVLARNPVPSVLVEIAYLTHKQDADRLQDGAYQEDLLEALTEAVAAYLHATANPL